MIASFGNLRALGLEPDSADIDGTVSLNTSIMNLTRTSIDPSKYDLKAVVEHEIDEVLGTSSGVGGEGFFVSPRTADMYRYSNVDNVRSYVTGTDVQAFFSIDGTNRLVQYNQNPSGDYGDWKSSATPRVQDAFATAGATPEMAEELILLDVVGYDRVAESGPLLHVLEGTTPLADQSTVSFPPAALGTEVTRTFTIRNDGTAPLLLNNVELLDGIDGFPTIDFFFRTEITPNTEILPGTSLEIPVGMNTEFPGPRLAILKINTNDAGFASGFVLNLDGSVAEVHRETSTFVSVPPSATVGDFVTVDWEVTALDPLSPPVGGTAHLFIDNVESNSSLVSPGLNAFIVGDLTAGFHIIEVRYSGDPAHDGSSGSGSIEVARGTTSVSVSSLQNPSVLNSSVTLTAEITFPGIFPIPTGAVTFSDQFGEIDLGTIDVDPTGHAQLEISSLGLGTHSIVATYHGDGNFDGSTSEVFIQTVTDTTTSPEIQVLFNGADIVDGTATPLNFGTTTIGNNLDKTFTIKNLGTAPLNLDSVNFPPTFTVLNTVPSSIDAGQEFVLTVRHSAANTGVSGGTVTIVCNDNDESTFNFAINAEVTKAASATRLTSSANPAAPGQPVTFTATVSPSVPGGPVPTGNVTFHVNGNPIGTVNLINGVATVTSSTLPGGVLTIRANYNGSSIFLVSEKSLTQTVAAGSPEIQVLNGAVDVPDNTGTVAVGSVLQGTVGGLLKTLTVKNVGTSPLKLQPAKVTLNTGFTIVTNFTVNQVVAPGSSVSLEIRLDSATPGAKTTDVTFVTDDPSENPFNFKLTGTVTAPEIQVLQGTADIIDNSTVALNFGSVVQGAVGLSKTFTIKNTGNGNLVLQPVSVPAGYTVVTPIPAGTILAPLGTKTFTVRLDSSILGTKSGSISFVTTDTSENPFNFAITGKVVAPEIQVLNGAVDVPDNTGTVAVGSVLQGTVGGLLKTLTVKNVGTSPLKLQPAKVTLNTGFTIVTNFTLNQLVAPGATASLVIRLDSATPGAKTTDVTFVTDDASENPFNFKLTGTVTAPEIQVLQGTADIIDNSTTALNFGSVVQGAVGISKTFTIKNTGNGNLVLQPVSVPAGYTVVTPIPAGTILAPLGTKTFTVRLDSVLAGTKTGSISFGTTDTSENPFNFAITGVVKGRTLDNRDSGFTTVGTWSTTSFGRNGDQRQSESGTGSNIARWSFAGLAAGRYRVSATWQPLQFGATNAQFTMRSAAGGAALASKIVDQAIARAGVPEDGSLWIELGTVQITGSSLVIELSNLANGIVVADAIRIERLS